MINFLIFCAPFAILFHYPLLPVIFAMTHTISKIQIHCMSYLLFLSLIAVQMGPGDIFEHKLKFCTASAQRGRLRSRGEIDDLLARSRSAERLRLLPPFSDLASIEDGVEFKSCLSNV